MKGRRDLTRNGQWANGEHELEWCPMALLLADFGVLSPHLQL